MPAGGIVKSPALVASNRKALEQFHLSKQNLVFDAENANLEASLINQHHAGECMVDFLVTSIIFIMIGKGLMKRFF